MQRTIIIPLLFSLVCFAGCGNQDNPFGAVYVEGTVTLDGAPVDGVNITFLPLGDGMAAGGITDARGRYTVTTGGSRVGSGAQPGTYNVIFSKVEYEGLDLSMEEFRAQFGVGMAPRTFIVPQRYGNEGTTGFEPVTVTTNRRDNVFNFALTTEP